MAIFEKVKSARVLLDDSVPLLCNVDSGHIVGDHVEYGLKIKRGVTAPASAEWTLTKRYSDFANLDTALRQNGVPAPLPPKRVFGNKDREFIAERKQKLQQFLTVILGHPLLSNSLIVRQFLDNRTYGHSFQGLALQHISMFFRSELGWEVVEPLPEIGWRLRKCYFSVRKQSSPKQKYVLSWSPLGPHSSISDKDCSTLVKLLPNFQHKYLFPVELAFANESGGLSIRRFSEQGTLRDVICKTKPKGTCMKKYVKPKAYFTLTKPQIQTFGRQILEALKFLQEKNFPYGHLHSSNIIVEDNCCKLLDIENFLLGLPSFYRPCVVELKKVKTIEAIDVYSFGLVLFEMAFGIMVTTPSLLSIPESCSPDLREILSSILSAEGQKAGLPTVQSLLENPFFSAVSIPAFDKPQLKIPSKLKEVIRTSKQEKEEKLSQEQKVTSQYHRQVKVKSHHLSEDEKRKRRLQKRLSQKQMQSEDGGDGGAGDTPAQAQPAAVSQVSTGKLTTNGQSVAPPPAVPPPVAPPPPPPPPANGPSSPAVPAATGKRGALLSSISGFSKGGLKKAVTVDKSGPLI